MTKYTICLDAGHSYAPNTGGDPGAVNGSYNESEAALQIVNRIGLKLAVSGHKIVYTRTGGKAKMALSERTTTSNKANADVFLSIHLNASDNKSASGIETLRYSKVGATTKALATQIQRSLVQATGFKDRGVKERDNLYVLKHTKAPAVLVEVGFISNDEECKKLFSEHYQEIIAQQIADSTIKVLEGFI